MPRVRFPCLECHTTSTRAAHDTCGVSPLPASLKRSGFIDSLGAQSRSLSSLTPSSFLPSAPGLPPFLSSCAKL
eukprot:5455791-Prymnesium_polylepis.1